MQRLLILLSVLILPSYGAITIVAHTGAQSTNANSVTTPAIDTTGATVIFLTAAINANALAVLPTDSKGNSWNLIDNIQQASNNPLLVLYYCVNCIVGSGHTFSYSNTTLVPSITILAVKGTDGGLLVKSHNNNSATPGSITPVLNNSLIVTYVGLTPTTSAYSISGGFTITDSNNGTPGNAHASSMAYLIQTSASAANPTWTITGGSNPATLIIAVAPTVSSGGTSAHSFGVLK